MQFIKNASYTSDWKGVDYSKEELQVVPDQSLSLQEILEKFVRNEEVEVGHPTWYDENEESLDDLEKIRHSDLVDKDLYIKSLKEIQSKFETEEKQREDNLKKEAWEKALSEAREKALAEQKQEPAK